MNWGKVAAGSKAAASTFGGMSSKVVGGVAGFGQGFMSPMASGVIAQEAISAGKWLLGFTLGLLITYLNFLFVDSIAGKAAILILFPILYTFIFQSYNESYAKAYRAAGIWTIISIIVPLLIFYGAEYAPIYVTNLLSLVKLYILAWPLWMCVLHKSDGFLPTLLESVLFLVIGGSLVLQVWASLTVADGLLNNYVQPEDIVLLVETTERIKEIAFGLPSTIYDFGLSARNASLDIANRTQTYVLTGKSFEEQVDSDSAADTLGLNFKSLDFYNLDAKFKEGQEISSWALLETSNLDTPITIETYCKLDPKTDPVDGDVSIDNFKVYQYDLKDIICTIPAGTIEGSGVHELRTFANFDYTVLGYVRRYFIEQSELTELQANGLDPFAVHKIPSSDEASRHTSGPIDLTIIKSNLLQGIDVNNPTNFVVGLRFDKNLGFSRDGLLKNLSLLVLAVPDGFSVARDSSGEYSCSGGTVDILPPAICEQRCVVEGQIDDKCFLDCDSLTHYSITVPTTKDHQNNNEDYIKTPSQISCYIEPSRSIFSKEKVVSKSFIAYADYHYQVSIGKSFTVLEDPNYKGSDFKELIYCDNYYSTFGSTETETTNQIKSAAKEFVNAQSYSGVCTPIIKGMVAFNYRSGSKTGSGIGATGINLDRYRSIADSAVSTTDIENNPVVHTNAFLQHYLEGACIDNQGRPSIDCALNYFYCGKESSCASSKVVVSLANSYSSEGSGS